MIPFSQETLRVRHIKEAQFNAMARDLQTGDIVLLHTRYHTLSALIRHYTKSYWNHVVIVLSTFETLPGYQGVLVVEASNDGIEIHRIQHYFENGLYYIGVKRVPNLTQQERDSITGYILSQVDSPYDMRRLAKMGFALMAGQFKRIVALMDNKSFTCSSFIQKAYYFASAPERRAQFIFAPDTDEARQLEFLSPADIARSRNSVWIFNKR